MRSQFVDITVPDWAEGLPPETVQAVRQEAMKRDMRPQDLVKEWTLKAAKSLTTPPALPTLPEPQTPPTLNSSPTEGGAL